MLRNPGNWPAATKAVSEWFPKHERGLATALFDSGSSIGGAIAPFMVLWIYFHLGWRTAFAVPGLLGDRCWHGAGCTTRRRNTRASVKSQRGMILADTVEPGSENKVRLINGAIF